MCRCYVLVQLLLHPLDVDVLLNLDDVLLDAILRFDVSDVVLLPLDAICEHFDICDVLLFVLLRLLLGDCKLAFHDVDVHLVNLDVFADVDDTMLKVHPILRTIHVRECNDMSVHDVHLVHLGDVDVVAMLM